MKKKKIIFFIGGLNFGGMERIDFIACELLKNKYDISLMTLYKTNADYDVDIPTYDLNVPPQAGKINKLIVFLRRLHKTRIMKKRIEADVVFSFGMYSNYLNALTKKKEKIIMGIRSYDWLTNAFTIPIIDRYIVSKFNSVNSVSKLIAHDAVKYWKISQDKNRVIYNPYDIELINNKSLEIVDDFCFEPDNFYFITMGRLANQKGFNHLIHSFKRLYNNYKNVRLIIMGDGNKKDDIDKLIKEYGLDNKIFLIGGKKNPYKYIKRADCYVLSSHSEGFPNAMVEAMCLGKIVIATNCPSGPSEIFLNQEKIYLESSTFKITEFGILTSSFTYDDRYEIRDLTTEEKTYEEAMEYVYCNFKKLYNIGNNASKRVSQFNYEVFKQNLILEINSVLNI